MKLSEAMRLGAMLRPQAYGWFFINGRSCAQGAALEACGVTAAYGDLSANFALHDDMERLFPIVEAMADCPACHDFGTAGHIIAHLNNGHRWTREQIADWVEQLERAEGQSADCAQPVQDVPASDGERLDDQHDPASSSWQKASA